MRLLMTTDAVGGVWTFSTGLTAGLLDGGYEVFLVVVGPAATAGQTKWLTSAAARWPEQFWTAHVDVPLEWMEDGRGCYAESQAEMIALCAEFRPDVLHSNQLCYGALPLLSGDAAVPKLVVGHSDVLSWWRARHGTAMPPSAWKTAYVDQVGAGLCGADLVVAPSAASLAELHESFAFSTDARVIFNGRSTGSGTLPEAELLSGKRLQAMTCGRAWDEGKNVALLECLTSAPLPLLIAGDTGGANALPHAAGEQQTAHATYTGRLSADEVEQLMRESAIYVVTSRYEPFGYAATEAALAGCALVVSDLPSQREIWGDAPLYFPTDDAARLADRLRALAENPDLVRSVAQRCRALVHERFSAQAMVSQYVATYDGLIRAAKGYTHGDARRGLRVA